MQPLQPIQTPLNKQQVQKVSAWMRSNFQKDMDKALATIPVPDEIAIAIACKETGSKFINWIDKYPADVILSRCIGDTSGEPEFSNAPRSAFPKNRDEFVKRYDKSLLDMLVGEYNKTRAMQGWKPAPYLAKGYGLFQYDLQNIINDKEFFADKLWYKADCVFDRFKNIIGAKMTISTKPELYVALYNGRGARAEAYAKSVLAMAEWA